MLAIIAIVAALAVQGIALWSLRTSRPVMWRF